MRWRIITVDTAWSDVESLSESDRLAIADALVVWVDNGPPRSHRRLTAGAELFEDEVASRYQITYFVNEVEQYVALLRVRQLGR